jgi:cytochrome c553
VKYRISAVILGVVCFALGAVVQRGYDVRRGAASTTARVASVAKPAPPASAAPAPVWTAASSVDFTREPLWAWGVTEPGKADDPQAVQGRPGAAGNNANARLTADELDRKRHVTGSRLSFSLKELRTVTNPNAAGAFIDWFPDDHPTPVPDVIKYGPAAMGKNGRPCATCHLSDGSGRPENASPAGLPAGYILRQLNDFKHDLRHSADPRKGNSNTMVMLAKGMSDEEMRQAATYYASVRWREHVHVVETRLVPKTLIQGELFIPQSTQLTEPIGKRIIEVPANIEESQTLRSSRGEWIAYVPVGAIKKGQELVTTGGMRVVNGRIVQGQSTACATCHGPDLMGIAPDVPPIVGRSPSYQARELFDIQQGTRLGSNSNVALMRMVVAKLSPEDILDIVAYLASLPVPGAPSAPPAATH